MGTAPLDPKKLVITTRGRQYNTPESDGTVVFMVAHDFLNQSVDQISEYVQQFGTLKTLTIVGHGTSTLMDAEHNGADPTTQFEIPDFLRKLKEIQNNIGIKVADRIVFDACATMTKLPPIAVNFFRDAAKSLGSEIVGATTTVGYDEHNYDNHPIVDTSEAGLFAAFEPDGSVRRDRTSATGGKLLGLLAVNIGKGEWFHGNRTKFRQLTTGESDLEKKFDAGWFACHEGKSQEEGAACQLGEKNPLPKARADSRHTGVIKANVKDVKDDGEAGKKAEILPVKDSPLSVPASPPPPP